MSRAAIPGEPAAAPTLSLVIPAWLEEENLRFLLPRIRSAVDSLAVPAEILVIDGAEAADGTRSVCEAHGVRWVPQRGTGRYGAAVRTGIAEARGEYILFMDADGSHSPELIPALWAPHEPDTIVVASRYVPGGATENPRVLIWMSWVLNVLYRIVLGIDCRDISTSFKLYPGGILRRLRLRCDHFDIIEEILVRFIQEVPSARIREIPFVFKKRLFGQTKRELLLFVLSFYVTLVRLAAIRIRGAKRTSAAQPPA